ncbi:lysylphosphatidylglycerol synthase transmembrane domain-containing protein [Jannaschia rubra]|uniref:lysylphosphatidylglycerol synthase transmembrane domain-containing protein n=1 Tax=Jannaschia rubra TaxID=282197 RepID=UPI0024939B2A|nr:lysylphosphatidylglycerol synthase transmembrane domain-containing protein [Jannaschia rubra]
MASSRGSFLSGRIGAALRLTLSVAVLALLWVWLDGATILRRFVAAQPGWVALAILGVQAQTIASAWRWRLTAEALGRPLTMGRAVREYYVAGLLNMTLPGGVAGDAARIARGRDADGWRAAAAPVVVERLAGQIAMWLLASLGLALSPLMLGAPVWVAVAGAVAAAGGAGGAVLGARRAGGGVRGLLHRAWVADGAWRAQVVLSPAIAASYVAVFILCARALGHELPLGAALTVVPLTLLAMTLPLSVGGWGLREGAAAALWPLAGLMAADGVAAAALYGLVCLAGALPGAVFLWSRPA